MKPIDKLFLSFVLYPIFPILLFLIGWWGSLSLISNGKIFTFAIIGLILGIVIDLFFVSKIIPHAYRIHYFWAILVVIFYAAGMFGFFMGVPVFHFFLGFPLGWYVARRSNILHLSPAQSRRELFLARLFGLCIMGAICIASAFIALNDPYTASSLKGMLSLPFDVTGDMLIGIILVGGTALVIGEYFLIPFVAKISKTSML